MDKPYELCIDLGRGFLYFPTESDDVHKAKTEFISALNKVGINTDNFSCEGYELRKWNKFGGYTVVAKGTKF